MSRKRNLTLSDVADVIERFLEGRSLYPQEWNDFVDTAQQDKDVEASRRRCDELDWLVNRPGEPDKDAVIELRSMVETLRAKNSGPSRTEEDSS